MVIIVLQSWQNDFLKSILSNLYSGPESWGSILHPRVQNTHGFPIPLCFGPACLVPSVFGLRHPTMNWPWDYSQGRIGWSILYPRVHNTPGFPIPRWFGQFDFPKQGPQVLSWLPWWWWLSSSNLGKMIFWNPFCQICPVDQSWGGVFCTLRYTIL